MVCRGDARNIIKGGGGIVYINRRLHEYMCQDGKLCIKYVYLIIFARDCR